MFFDASIGSSLAKKMMMTESDERRGVERSELSESADVVTLTVGKVIVSSNGLSLSSSS